MLSVARAWWRPVRAVSPTKRALAGWSSQLQPSSRISSTGRSERRPICVQTCSRSGNITAASSSGRRLNPLKLKTSNGASRRIVVGPSRRLA